MNCHAWLDRRDAIAVQVFCAYSVDSEQVLPTERLARRAKEAAEILMDVLDADH